MKGALVASCNFFNAVDSWVEDIAVEGEAVRSTIHVRWDGTSETVKVDHLVSVVELQDVANALDGVHVLVSIRVQVVERIWRSRVAIRQSEIDGD